MKNINTKIKPDDFYTPLGMAKNEIRRRWNDRKLKKKVEDFLDNKFPVSPEQLPRGVFPQYIITRGHDTDLFVEFCKKLDIEPLVFEFTEDKFVSINPAKYLLGKLFFSDDKKVFREDNIPRVTIVDFNSWEGKKINEVKTIWGEKLVDFHHNTLHIALPFLSGKVYDISAWFQETRFLTEYYYLYFLSIFICHGILFDNIELDGREADFTKHKIIPSFFKNQEIFGVKPLICPLIPVGHEEDFYWWCYPQQHKEVMKNYVKSKFNYNLDIK